MAELILRDYQQAAVDNLRQAFREKHKRVILQAPCGAGKTIIAAHIIKSALEKNKRVIFAVNRINLVDQTADAFESLGLDFGIVQGNHWRVNDLPLQICSVQTLIKRKNKPDADLIIWDESHNLYKSMIEFIDSWSAVPVIGLTATPWTKGLGKIYSKLLVVETTQNLIARGYLADFIAYGAEPIDMKGVRTVAGDYNGRDLEKKVNKPKIVGDVVESWLRLGENRQTVCFSVNVAHAEAIADEFNANGVTAAVVEANTQPEDREMIFSDYENGTTKILVNCGITTFGWDSPNTTCLILARPTKSLMLYIQMVNRVLRVSDCGSKAIILDHGGNIERLGFPTDPLPEYLDNGEKEERATREAEEKKEKLPKACEKCYHLSTEFICPACGHKPAKMPNVEAVKGELKKLSKASMTEKTQWLSELTGYARKKGYKDGWASHKYREKFGAWPAKKTGIRAVEPGREVLGFIQYLNIKRAKSRYA